MEKKKIVIYMRSMCGSGGIERVVSNLCRSWAEEYDLTLLTKDAGESFYPLPEGIRKVSLGLPLTFDMTSRLRRMADVGMSFLRCRGRLKKALEAIKPDYIYVESPMGALEAASLGRTTQNKLVISEHGSYYGYNRVYTAIKKRVYPKAYCVSVLNRMDTEIYRSWGAKAVYVPHLVTYRAEEKNRLDSRIVLNVGRLTDDKQQEKLLRIWSRCTRPDGWQLWIVGDGENRGKLENLIAELHLRDCVRMIPATKDIQSIYKQASLFAFTSRNEGFGMVLLEAMSFGIPCISFDCPSGPRDIVQTGKNGALIQPDDEQAFRDALQALMEDDAQRTALGSGAFRTVQEWDNEAILRQWREIFA